MEWYPVASLEHSASLKIVTELFRSPAGLQTILSLNNCLLWDPDPDPDIIINAILDRSEYRRRMELFVLPLLEKLELPPKLERKLMTLCEPVSLQLAWWGMRLTSTVIERSCVYRPKMDAILAHARWKWDGRLDVEGSTQELVLRAEEERLPARRHFGRACSYFLEREPFLRWHRRELLANAIEESDDLLDCMPRYEREKDSIDDPNFWRLAQSDCANARNEPGVKRCWRRWLASMPHAQPPGLRPFFFRDCNLMHRLIELPGGNARDWCVVRCPCPPQPEIIRFLWSQLHEQHLKEVLVDNECVLGMFLEWPYQSLFLMLLRATWDFLNEHTFCMLLKFVLRNISPQRGESAELFDYRQLLKDFWTESPPKYKSCFLVRQDGLLDLLYNTQVEWMDIRETLTFVYKDFSIEEKRSFLDRYWERLRQTLMARKEWTKLDTFVDDFGECDGVNDCSSSGLRKDLECTGAKGLG